MTVSSKPTAAEGERNGSFLSEMERHVCGPVRAWNACFWQGEAWVQLVLWPETEATSWVAVCLLLAWNQGRCSIFPPALLHRWELSHAEPSPLLDSAGCNWGWCLFGLGNEWTQL